MKNKQNNKCVCVHENIRLIIRGHSKSTYVRPDLPVFDPPRSFPFVLHVTPPQRTFALVSYPSPSPQKKFRDAYYAYFE